MTCQKCKRREATRHESVRQEDGTWAEVHLCDRCADKGEVTLLTPASMIQAFIESAAAEARKAAGGGTAASCPACGITYAEFRARGRLGCPADYDVFHGDLLPLIERIHQGGTQHVGKGPSSTDGRSEVERELIELRRTLAEAVQREKYEEAARLRDRIQTLEEAAEGARGRGKAPKTGEP